MGDMMADVIRILIVDDDALVRSGLSMMLGGNPGIEVVGEAADGAQALDAVHRSQPDVVLMDIRMPGMDGLAATEALRGAGTAPAVIVLTTFDTDEHVLRALRAGANSFLLKDTPPLDILDAIRKVAAGETVLSPTVLTQLVDHVARRGDAGERQGEHSRAVLEALTEREREVALAVGQGRSNAQIGAELYMSVATVKTYVSRILAKLECGNRVQVAILVHESRHGR